MYFQQLMEWAAANNKLIAVAAMVGGALFAGTAAAVPFLINMLPADYFMKEKRARQMKSVCGAAFSIIIIIIKNLAGIILFAAGFALLFMPGQGLLTIFISLVLLDFPGKWKMQKRLIRNRKISAAVNWVRKKGGKEEIQVPPEA